MLKMQAQSGKLVEQIQQNREIPRLVTREAEVLVICPHRTVVLDESYHVDFPPLPSRSGPVGGSVSPGLGVLPNLGNTCFAAVAIRCLSHLTQHSQVDLSAIRDPNLRSLLMDLSPPQSETFCHHNKLVKGPQQDAVLWLQHYLDSEPVFHPLVAMSECLGLTCVGCDEPKTLESSLPVWQIPVPVEPLPLRELVANQCQRCATDPYLEISCPCCSAEHAERKTKVLTTSEWLLVQALRANPDDSQRCTAVSISEPIFVCDQPQWELQLAISHIGATATSGHYVLFVRSDVGWVVHDDGFSHSATTDELSALSSTWTFAAFRRAQPVVLVPTDLVLNLLLMTKMLFAALPPQAQWQTRWQPRALLAKNR
eukprot:s1268_g9.t1